MFFRKQSKFNEDDLPSIVAACQEQDAHAQRALFKLFFSYAKSICLRYSSNQEEAEEVLNDGFLKVFKNIQKYDLNQPFKAWLRTILVNTCIDYYRRREKYTYELDVERVENSPFDENVLDKIAADEILAMVQKLPNSYRTVFMMHVIDGYNHREIADLLHINEGTSRSNFLKARAKLQDMIKLNYPHLYAISLTKKINEN
ncbi:MAG: RNA polymerase sigma factor [Runella slithyformis]|nr:MAG: RNA polymerase sigma factor [Runella slithyformis]TAF44080.1 MAG: RNA polymerase sigma factor [Runella slithyformis]